jgi:hypothetical protein
MKTRTIPFYILFTMGLCLAFLIRCTEFTSTLQKSKNKRYEVTKFKDGLTALLQEELIDSLLFFRLLDSENNYRKIFISTNPSYYSLINELHTST